MIALSLKAHEPINKKSEPFVVKTYRNFGFGGGLTISQLNG